MKTVLHPAPRGASAVLVVALFVVVVSTPGAEPWERQAPILQAPQPFSVSSADAVLAVRMIRAEPALLKVDDIGERTIVPVRTVRSEWVGFDPDAYEPHQNRYDVILNDDCLDWDHLYIEYGGRMINLRLLFTYRNQRPVPDVTYRVE